MTNCQLMNGLDWRSLGWAEYQTRLATWNARHEIEGGRIAPDLDGVRKAMAGVMH